MKSLSIDIETYCDLSLPAVGVYKYASHPSFEVLLFAYSVDHNPVQVVDLAQGGQVPAEVLEALSDPEVTKWAFNAQFERTCLSAMLGQQLQPEGWKCSMVWATFLGMNLGLAGVAQALRLDAQKMTEGKRLIDYFSKPCRPTKANGGRTRNLPEHAPEDWATFGDYCARDVEVEQEIQSRLARQPMPEAEWENYWLDQEINDRGVMLDMDLVHQAIEANNQHREEMMSTAREVTQLENPNSPTQMLSWLHDRGVEIPNMTKQAVSDALETASGDVEVALRMRVELAKSSVKKYEAMDKASGSDDRARGLLQFVGAGRTGRWAGRLIQVQNLPRQHTSDLAEARELLKLGEFEALEMLWGSTPNVLSELIRTAFIPKPGNRFIVADYSAIEARVIAWLAGERWVLDLFENGGDIYCETGTRMFGQEVTKHSPLRQKAKVAVLACGYQGGPGALTQMGALEMGIEKAELQPLVDAWRNANQRIVTFWYNIDRAAKTVIKTGQGMQVGQIRLTLDNGILFLWLPSGRQLSYPSPRIGENRFGGESITFMGVGENRKWSRLETYGGKLVENIVQATARDVLAESMMWLEDFGYQIVMHVHDEVVIEAPSGFGSLEAVCDIMSTQPKWAQGLPLAAEGFESTYYRKG